MRIHSFLILAVAIIFFVSCDRPECTNTNPVFDSNGIETIDYKRELASEIERIGMENLTYWFSDYTVQNGKEFITVNIQGEGLCALGILQVNEWTNIEGIKKTAGVSYRGAELKGLVYDIVDDGSSINFIYQDIEHIVD